MKRKNSPYTMFNKTTTRKQNNTHFGWRTRLKTKVTYICKGVLIETELKHHLCPPPRMLFRLQQNKPCTGQYKNIYLSRPSVSVKHSPGSMLTWMDGTFTDDVPGFYSHIHILRAKRALTHVLPIQHECPSGSKQTLASAESQGDINPHPLTKS